jgi:hypothetical protein
MILPKRDHNVLLSRSHSGNSFEFSHRLTGFLNYALFCLSFCLRLNLKPVKYLIYTCNILIVILVRSLGPKGHVSFCHHFVSVTKITNLVEDHPGLISKMLQFHQLSSFWQEDFQSFNQSEHIIGLDSHVGFPICTKITKLNVFWLVETLKIFLSETTQLMEL